MSNEIESEMPTYTCEKCARTFSQKSHYTAHQKKKIDCSSQTNISVAKSIIEKEEIKEMNEKYFDINDYKLYEIPDFISYAVELTDNTIINAMTYMNYSPLKYEGFIFYTNFYQKGGNFDKSCYDVLILEPGITLIVYDNYDDYKYDFTEKDIKYFPLLQIRNNCKYRVEALSENPVKIVSFTNDIRRKVMQTKFHTNNSMIEFNQVMNRFYIINIKLPLFSDFVENLHLNEIREMLTDNEIFSMLSSLQSSSSSDEKQYDGFSHPISEISPFVDIIVLNDFITAIIYNRNGTFIELTVNDTKYVPVYLMKNVMVKLFYKEDKRESTATAITFLKTRLSSLTYDFDSFVIKDGVVKKK